MVEVDINSIDDKKRLLRILDDYQFRYWANKRQANLIEEISDKGIIYLKGSTINATVKSQVLNYKKLNSYRKAQKEYASIIKRINIRIKLICRTNQK